MYIWRIEYLVSNSQCEFEDRRHIGLFFTREKALRFVRELMGITGEIVEVNEGLVVIEYLDPDIDNNRVTYFISCELVL